MQSPLTTRLLYAALIVIVITGLMIGLFAVYAGGQSALSPNALDKASGDAQLLASILGDIAGALRMAVFAAMGTVLVGVMAFVIAIDMRPPGGDVAASRWRRSWILGLFVVWIIAGVATWLQMAPITENFESGHRALSYVIVEAGATLAFWLAAAFGVRRTARVAVPLGDAMLNR